ncbi:MAG: PEP-CTERM sorting domain-containing protein [Stellaceae bacterium]
MRGDASYTDTNFIFFGPTVDGTNTLVTGKIAMTGSATATPQALGEFDGFEFINGQVALRCAGIAPAEVGPDSSQFCFPFTVLVPVGVPISVTLQLTAGAGANGGFSQTGTQQGISNFADTFSFPIGSDVFGLEPGVTVNAPDSFIFDNRYLPPDATAVPEPSSALVLIIGLAGLGVLRHWSSRVRAAGA